MERALTEREASTDKSEFASASNLIRPQIVPADYLEQAGDLVHRAFLAGLLDSWHVGQTDIEARAIAKPGFLTAIS